MSQRVVFEELNEADRAEWRRLSGTFNDLHNRKTLATAAAGRMLVHRLQHPDEADIGLEKAIELAQLAFDLDVECQAAFAAAAQAHPHAAHRRRVLPPRLSRSNSTRA
jgi:hypothetical protein